MFFSSQNSDFKGHDGCRINFACPRSGDTLIRNLKEVTLIVIKIAVDSNMSGDKKNQISSLNRNADRSS